MEQLNIEIRVQCPKCGEFLSVYFAGTNSNSGPYNCEYSWECSGCRKWYFPDIKTVSMIRGEINAICETFTSALRTVSSRKCRINHSNS